MNWKLPKRRPNPIELPAPASHAQAARRLLRRADASAIESLEARQLLSTTAINSNDAIPFNKIVIDPNPGGAAVVKVLGDLTNDGKLDAIIGHESNFGSGGLDWYQFPASGNPNDPWIEHVIDPNADCYEQGAVANISGHVDSHGNPVMDIVMEERGTIVWYENPLGDGEDPTTATWTKHVIGTIAQGATHDMVLTDLDGDGKLDVVTTDAIFFQNSPDSWTQVANPTYNRTERGLYLFDSGSGLGSVDLVGTSNGPDFQIGWYENPRDDGGNARTDAWTFHAIAPVYSGFQEGDGLSYAAEDVNGDGRMDIITADGESANPLTGGLIWWEAPANPATGTWIPHTIDASLTDVYSLVLADMNGDGTPEILAFEEDASPLGRLMIVYNEGGTGQNWLEQTIDTGAGQNEKAGDITGDGNLDILSAPDGVGTNNDPVSVYINQLSAQGVVAPIVTSSPPSQSNYLGNSTVFSVAATGTGPLTYQWQFNGLDIPGATSSNFTLENIEYSSGGVYRCIVGNSAGLVPSAGATLTVLDPGPTVSAGSDQTTSVLLPVTLSGSVAESALPPNGNLTYNWSELSGPGTVGFVDPSSLSTTVNFSTPGNYVLQLAASDGTVTNASQVNITVTADPGPVVSAGPDQTISLPNDSITLEGSVTQSLLPPGHVLSAAWSELSGPSTVIFADAGSTAITATFPAIGTYVLQLAGTDGITTNTSQVDVTVNPPAAIEGRVVSALNGSGVAGRTVYIDANQDGQLDDGEIGTITDASGNFAFSNLPAGNYQISQVLPAGVTSADPGNNVRDVMVAASQTLNGVDFADLPAPTVDGPSLDATFLKRLPSSVVGGAAGTVSIKITNGGSATASGPQTLSLLASTTGNFSAGNVVVTTASLGTLTLKPNASKSVTIKFDYPSGLSSGSYSLLAVPDSSNSVPQSSFNIAESSAVMISPAFVQLDAALPGRPPKTVTAGKSSSVSVQVSNGGNESSSGPLTINLYESPDSALDADDVLLGTMIESRGRIAAGALAIYHVAFKTPTNIVSGNEYIVGVLSSGSTAASASTVTFN